MVKISEVILASCSNSVMTFSWKFVKFSAARGPEPFNVAYGSSLVDLMLIAHVGIYRDLIMTRITDCVSLQIVWLRIWQLADFDCDAKYE